MSFAQSPLTTDYGAMSFYMRKLQPGQMPFGGTSIGRALDDAADLLTWTRRQRRGADLDGERSEMKRADNQTHRPHHRR